MENLIRNGDFERGDTSHWTNYYGCNISAQGVVVKTGNYALKVDYTFGFAYVLHDTYIPIKKHYLYELSCYAKAEDTTTLRYRPNYLDKHGNKIGEEILNPITITTEWKQLYVPIYPAFYADYMILYLWLIPNSIVPTYFDNFYLIETPIYKIQSFFTQLTQQLGITTNGNSASEYASLIPFNNYIADLDITAVSGTTPTLDVEIIDYNSILDKEIVAGSFTQATEIGTERIKLSNVIGEKLYVKWTVGGTNPSFDFTITIGGKR